MIAKKKMCAGFNGNPHEDYIYKNVNGEKYCKSCTLKLQPPKAISKVSKKNTEKYKFKITLKQDQYQKDSVFYRNIWLDRFYTDELTTGERILYKSPKCFHCRGRLGEEPNLMFFHHLLEKRNYPEYRYLPENICILCPNCHNRYETFPDRFPDINKLKEALYYKLKNE